MHKVTYVEIEVTGQKGPAAFAVLLNGRPVAVDEAGHLLTCSEIAANLADALDAQFEHRTAVVPPEWDLEEHVLPALGIKRDYPVFLSIEEDVQFVAEAIAVHTKLGYRTAPPISEVPPPSVIRRAAQIARDAILQLGYFGIIRDALKAALEEAEKEAGAVAAAAGGK